MQRSGFVTRWPLPQKSIVVLSVSCHVGATVMGTVGHQSPVHLITFKQTRAGLRF